MTVKMTVVQPLTMHCFASEIYVVYTDRFVVSQYQVK